MVLDPCAALGRVGISGENRWEAFKQFREQKQTSRRHKNLREPQGSVKCILGDSSSFNLYCFYTGKQDGDEAARAQKCCGFGAGGRGSHPVCGAVLCSQLPLESPWEQEQEQDPHFSTMK